MLWNEIWAFFAATARDTCRNGVESGGAMQVCRRVNVGKFAGWRKVRGEVTRVGKGVTGWDKRFRGW